MKVYKSLLSLAVALAALFLCSESITAQDALSPYSRFGYGILRNNANAAQRQMGGVGYAMNSGRSTNVMNPASYAAIDSMTFLFDMGLDFTTVKSLENGSKDTRYGGGLDYITLQFPITSYMGGSVGLIPYSSVGYSFGTVLDNGTDTRQGSGGLNQLYFGLGGNPFKGFYLGFNVGYLFGTTVNDIYVRSSVATSLFQQVFEVRDWHFQAGVQYKARLNRNNSLTFGLTYTPSKTLLGHARVVKYDVTSKETPDTVGNVNLRNNYSLSESWGAGINWEWREQLMVEADFTYQPWSKAKFLKSDNFIATEFSDRWQASLGAQYTPDQRGSFFRRTTYRLGGFFNHDYMKVGDNNVREFGLSLGFGLPAPSSKTRINLGFEWRQRQAHPTALLKENYFNVTVGVNFNELWFFKNKLR